MVKFNYCPSCGSKLSLDNFCSNCNLNIEDLFNEGDIMNNQQLEVNPGDEIVIVVPESDDDEIVIDLDELGIDLESLGDDVNIVFQIEGEDGDADFYEDDDEMMEPNEWYFDDDPYEIVYYEFPDFDDD